MYYFQGRQRKVLPEDRSQNLNDLSDRVDLNNTFEQEKNVIGVSFDLNYSRALNESTKTWVKNLLLFYKHKITLLENQNYFLLNQNNFLQHQKSQSEHKLQKVMIIIPESRQLRNTLLNYRKI